MTAKVPTCATCGRSGELYRPMNSPKAAKVCARCITEPTP